MTEVLEKAHAKINLTLDVLGKRPDGYHDLRSVMQTVSLCDDVAVAVNTGRPWRVSAGCPGVPDGAENLAWRAAEAFEAEAGAGLNGVDIRIVKRVPSQAGLGGGSADAAAVLRALNRLCGGRLDGEALRRAAARVGSDVPFCVRGGTALAEGRGERLTALPPMPDVWFVLAKPDFSASTPALFRRLDERGGRGRPRTDEMLRALAAGDPAAIGAAMGNDFEAVLAQTHPALAALTAALRAHGALGACLTGSGSVAYGLFASAEAAGRAAEALASGGMRTYLAKNV